MKVVLTNLTGVDDAIRSLYMSKRTWTPEKEEKLKRTMNTVFTREGTLIRKEGLSTKEQPYLEYFEKEFENVLKYGLEYGHTTLLRFIDMTFLVDGLHRGAMDY